MTTAPAHREDRPPRPPAAALLAVLWLLCCLPATAGHAELDDAAKLLARPKTRARAIRQLRRLTRSRDELTAIRATVLVAPYLRQKPRAAGTLDHLLAPYSQADAKNLVYPRVEGFAQFARTRARRGHLQQAVQLLAFAAEHAADGLPKAVIFEAQGDLARVPNDLHRAARQYKQALAHGDAYFTRPARSQAGGDRAPAKPGSGHWQRIRPRIAGKLADIQRQLRIDAYGLDFVLYAEARQAQADGRFAAALAAFDQLAAQIPVSVYGEAARFYRCFCVADGKDPARTVELLDAFVQANPQGLYRGEALVRIAGLTLHRDWDVRAAERRFRRAIDWCGAVRRADRAMALTTVPAKSRIVSRPPAASQSMNSNTWIIRPRTIAPEKLLNRLTAPWYLNEVEKEARYALLYCLFAQNRWADARTVLEPVLDLDPLLLDAQRHGRVSTYSRLAACCTDKQLMFEAFETRHIPPDLHLRMLFGEIRYLDRRFKEAETIFRATLAEAEQRHHADAIAVSLLGLGDALTMQKRKREAAACFQSVIDRFPRRDVCARAHLCMGNIVGQRAYLQGTKEAAVEHYKQAMKLAPGTTVAETCMGYCVASLFLIGRTEEAEGLAKRLLARHPMWRDTVDQARAFGPLRNRQPVID